MAVNEAIVFWFYCFLDDEVLKEKMNEEPGKLNLLLSRLYGKKLVSKIFLV